MTTKIKTHKEWFQPIVRGLCDCGANKKMRIAQTLDSQVYAWGEYVRGNWRTVQYVCEACFNKQVSPRLLEHARGCGCSFALVARNGFSPLPPWITLNATCSLAKAS